MRNKPPALEGVITGKLIALHLNALHSAGKRFTESEADQKLNRALRRKTRISTSKAFQSGDQVFYKRSDSGYWKGPGTVIGHDNKQVLVRHGGIYVRVTPCHLQLVSESEKTENVGTNEVESDFKNGMEIAEPEKKDEISRNRNIDHTFDDMLVVIKNDSNKSFLGLQQPTENVSTLSNMLDQLELDKNDCQHRNPTQITCTVPSLKSKISRSRYKCMEKSVSHQPSR